MLSRKQDILPWTCFFLLLILYLLLPNVQFSWDVGERSYILQHADQYIHPIDPYNPVNHFFYFAHILELPTAFLFKYLFHVSGLTALIIFETLCGFIVWIIGYYFVLRSTGSRFLSLMVVVNIALSFSYWRYATSGEEKMVQLAALLGFLLMLDRLLYYRRSKKFAILTGIVGGFAIGYHLMNLVIIPTLVITLVAILLLEHDKECVRLIIYVGAAVASISAAIILPAAFLSRVRDLKGLILFFTFYHRESGVNFFNPNQEPIVELFMKMFTGISQVFTPDIRLMILFSIIYAIIFLTSFYYLTREKRFMAIALSSYCIIWVGHFIFYQPNNSENWLSLFVILLVYLSGHISAKLRRKTIFALIICAFIMIPINFSQMYRLSQPTLYHRIMQEAEQIAKGQKLILLTTGGVIHKPRFQHLKGSYGIRILKGLAPPNIEVLSINELMKPELTDIIGIPPRDVSYLLEAAQKGTPIFCLSDAAKSLLNDKAFHLTLWKKVESYKEELWMLNIRNNEQSYR